MTQLTRLRDAALPSCGMIYNQREILTLQRLQEVQALRSAVGSATQSRKNNQFLKLGKSEKSSRSDATPSF